MIVNRIHWPTRTAIAHPNVSQFSDSLGCRTSAAPAIPVATIGATKAIISANNMIGPIPGMRRISSGEKRIIRNISQIAAQIPRQDTAVLRNDTLAICHSLRFRWSVCTELTARDERPLLGIYYFVLEFRFRPTTDASRRKARSGNCRLPHAI